MLSVCHCTLRAKLTGFMKRNCKTRQEQQRAGGVYKILVAVITMDFKINNETVKVRTKVSLWRFHVTVLAVEKQQYVSLYCAYTRTDGRDASASEN